MALAGQQGRTGWLALEPTGVRQHERLARDAIPEKISSDCAAPVESRATQPGPPRDLQLGLTALLAAACLVRRL